MNHNSFAHNQNKGMPNGQQPPQHGQPPQNQPQPVQQPPSIMDPPFGSLDADGFGGMNMDFAGLEGGDVLDNFDFDSFLNTGGDGDPGLGFDANFAFDGLEAGADLGGGH